MATSAAAAIRSPSTFASSALTCRICVGEEQRALLGLDARHQLRPAHVEPRTLERRSSLCQLGFGRLPAPARFRFDLVHLGFGLLQLRPALLDLPLLHGRVELHHDVAGRHGRAVGGQFDDLHVAPAAGAVMTIERTGRISPRTCR